ncbi:hypothetical protein AD942_06315 [Gluconobacter japonicus]|nr:hypothetical protein AD942_06315 [Gluconobacter japonicus]
MLELLDLRISIQLANAVLSAETVFLEWYAYSDRPCRTENICKLQSLRHPCCQQQQIKLSISD